MAEIIRMPRLTDTMEHGIILQWYKQIGDQIKVDDSIVEIETDKAAMDLDSYWKGYLLYQGGQNGNEINVNDILCIIGEQNENINDLFR